MTEIYTLRNALTLNATGLKVDAVASPTFDREIIKHNKSFNFDFISLTKNYTIYKLHVTSEPEIIQGFVGFRQTPGILECANMETNNFNKHNNAVYNGVGKALIALCCKISIDNGMEGFIYFDAKNRLVPYYQRFGAKLIFGLRMVIEPDQAKKLVDLYF
ncbi:hypothetical protein LXL81_26385 [Dyadobacter sp. CY356]|nr:hypothetical protein [Dyadobacter sp. CY356]